MGRDRLNLLYVSQFPPAPPTFGAQRRMQGLMAALARRHDLTAVSLISPDLDTATVERALRAYCREVVLVPGWPWQGPHKRLRQLRSLLSIRSFERGFYDMPALRRALDSLLSRRAFDVVNVEFPFLALQRLARGAINYFPNVDGILYLLREVWPRIAESHPGARLEIVGQHPTPEILAFRGPRVEVVGMVDDLRPHLARAAVSVVPLRIGGGTRFKILEAMAMVRPVVSTSLGAEGIEAEPGRHLLLADDPAGFAAAVGRILDDAQLGARLGREGRALVERRYSWQAAADRLDVFFRELLAA